MISKLRNEEIRDLVLAAKENVAISGISFSRLKLFKAKLQGHAKIVAAPRAFDFGEEFHRSILEPESLPEHELSDAEVKMLNMMTGAAKENATLAHLLQIGQKEIDSTRYGLRGRLDIVAEPLPHQKIGADLKTTSCLTESAFEKALVKYDNFLQATIYIVMEDLTKFLFIGVCKKKPRTFIIDCADYDIEMQEAEEQLVLLLSMMAQPEFKNIFKENK